MNIFSGIVGISYFQINRNRNAADFFNNDFRISSFYFYTLNSEIGKSTLKIPWIPEPA